METLTVAELIGSLEAHEKRLNSRDENSVESVFQSRLNIRSQESQDTAVRNFKKNSSGGKRSTTSKFPICGICKLTNHLEKDCCHK